MSERFTAIVSWNDDPTLYIKDNQTNKKYDLSVLGDVEKLCKKINGINDVKKENLSKVVEYSKDNELLYDVVDGFIALLKLKVEEKL